jgi:hypothetical protein
MYGIVLSFRRDAFLTTNKFIVSKEPSTRANKSAAKRKLPLGIATT